MLRDLSGKKILVVDDEPDLREILKDFFELSGADVVMAENGSVAYRLIESNSFDAVISDVRMPGGDGVMLAKNIHEMKGARPVLFLMTGYADILPSEAYNLGVQGFILKPFDLDAIETSLVNAFSQVSIRWARDVRAVVKELKTQSELENLVVQSKIQIGNGGIFIQGKYADLKVLDHVSFQTEGPYKIVGIVRWVNLNPDKGPLGIGLEFENLSENAIHFFQQKIEETKPKAFIPLGF